MESLERPAISETSARLMLSINIDGGKFVIHQVPTSPLLQILIVVIIYVCFSEDIFLETPYFCFLF